MKTHLRIATIVLLLSAPAALARVLSYAPYSDEFASRAQQSRTTRHVLVIEGQPQDELGERMYAARLVLYDTTGADEPRVIIPMAALEAAAMYQASADSTPIILVIDFEKMRLTRDLGATWIDVAETGRTYSKPWRHDYGGPFTRGLVGEPVMIGNAQYPFVIEQVDGRIAAIRADGTARELTTSQANLIGRNREGTRFLIASGTNVSIVDLDGRIAPVANDVAPEAGWITSEGSAYTLARATPNAPLRLRFHEHQQETFKTGSGAFFAVPTADYEGAWMVQQEPGEPTTLSRYLPGRGEEQLWNDPSGPQVEALIPGASGETLLIQTTRPRVNADTPFTGIALALWRVGQPAPAEYHELFARHGLNRGFAHVDPDTIADGSTFVFDTAFTGRERNRPNGLSQRPSTGGGADVLQEWGIVHGSFRQRLVLPTVSRTPGGYGSRWLTDVVLYNPLAVPQDVTVRFESATTTLTLASREIRVVPDVLQTLFDIERGGGPLHLEPRSAMTVTSRTYTPSGSGSLGFSMDAIDAANAATAHHPYAFAGAFPEGNFRTNLLLNELSGRGTQLTLHGFTTHIPILVPANATLPLGRVDPMLGTRGGLLVEPLYGRVTATVVAIDNSTNDATYFPPDLGNNDFMNRTFPAFAHVDLPDGWKLRTDLYLFNPAPIWQGFGVEVKPIETDQWPRGKGLALAPYEARVIPELLKTFFDLDGRARVRYGVGANGSHPAVRVTSRTYLVDPNGGTRGMLTPPLNNFQMAAQGETLEIVGQAGALRMGLGLVDTAEIPEGDPAVVRIHVFDDRGTLLDRFDEVLLPARGRYIEDLFAARRLTQPAAARVVVEVVTANSLIGAYGFLTDPVTRDLTYLNANAGGAPPR